MNYLKSVDLKDYELTFTEPYEYMEKKYKMNCLIKTNEFFKSIMLKTSKLQLQSNIKSGYIVVNINNNNEKNINFINFLKDIENSVEIYLKNKFKKKIKLRSSFIGDNKDYKYIFKTNETMSIFDKDKNKITLNNIEIYSDIILLIKLQNIWIDIEKKQFGLNWHIYQSRIYPEIDYNKCIIYDSESEEEEIRKEIIVQKCVFCNSTCIYNNTINNINIGKGKGGNGGKGIKGGKGGKGDIIKNNKEENKTNNSGRGNKKEKPKESMNIIPSADELLAIRNKLKKMIKNEDSD